MSKSAPTRYRTLNWSAGNAALRERGSLTVWFDVDRRRRWLCHYPAVAAAVRCICSSRARASKSAAQANGLRASTVVRAGGFGAWSIWPWRRRPRRCVLSRSPAAAWAMCLCCLIYSPRSPRAKRSPRSRLTAPTPRAAAATPSRTGARTRTRSYRPGTMPNRERRMAPKRQTGTRPCAPSSISAGLSGGTGPVIAAEAAPRPR